MKSLIHYIGKRMSIAVIALISSFALADNVFPYKAQSPIVNANNIETKAVISPDALASLNQKLLLATEQYDILSLKNVPMQAMSKLKPMHINNIQAKLYCQNNKNIIVRKPCKSAGNALYELVAIFNDKLQLLIASIN